MSLKNMPTGTKRAFDYDDEETYVDTSNSNDFVPQEIKRNPQNVMQVICNKRPASMAQTDFTDHQQDIPCSADALRAMLGNDQVRVISINNCSLSFDDIIAFMPIFPKKDLQSICLFNTNIGADAARYLAQNLQATDVNTIELAGNNLGDHGACLFADGLQNSQFTSIFLKNNQITDNGLWNLVNLLQNTNVKYLSVSENPITEVGILNILPLIQYTSLCQIELDLSNVTEATKQQLVYSLEQNALRLALKQAAVFTPQFCTAPPVQSEGIQLAGNNPHDNPFSFSPMDT